MKTILHTYDLPDDVVFASSVAVDTEAMGLNPHRDRLCLVQLTFDSKTVHLVHFPTTDFSKASNLKRLFNDANITKIFHFARFDVAILQYFLNVQVNTIYCTKIASHLTRTFTNKHGLKDLCKELLHIDLSKNEQTSDWGKVPLSNDQLTYAAKDVLHLHALKEKLDAMLIREQRQDLAEATFNYLPYRAKIDLLYGQDKDLMAYKIDGD